MTLKTLTQPNFHENNFEVKVGLYYLLALHLLLFAKPLHHIVSDINAKFSGFAQIT